MSPSEQGSPEWFAERCGKITASRMHDVMQLGDGSEFKSGPRKGQPRPEPLARSAYAFQLAAERITGRTKALVSARALQWGKDVEPAARIAYETETGSFTTPCGFVPHPDYDFIGASPDFLVGPDGGGEIKCPESQEVHLQTLIEGLPAEHIEQIQGGLWCSRRQWWDFVSFHPDFPPELRLYIQRVSRDEAYISQLESACLSLNRRVNEIIQSTRKE